MALAAPLRRKAILFLLALLLLGGWQFFRHLQTPPPPPGIAYGNGRLEATEVDVATKIAGRLTEVLVREGGGVVRNQVLARLDVEDPAAQLRGAEAQVRQAREASREAREGVRSADSQLRLARVTLKRTEQLVQKGFITGDKLDRDRSAQQTAEAARSAAQVRVAEADAATEAAVAKVESLRTTVNETTLKAPTGGRVLYRLAEPGEVLGVGGKALTLLDLSDVYLAMYLSAAEAGQVALGSEARILLDALPAMVIPAKVVFVAPRAQFTPKEVETRNEREKLMFRVKVKVAPEWLAAHADLAKPGMPGIAYVRTMPDAPWPPSLQGR